MTNHLKVFEDAMRSGDRDRIFYELVNHPTHPLTDAELEKLVALHPARWGSYAEYLGLLDDQVADRKLSALSGLGGRLA
jgi:hypothetical protein